jgi:hypothetical protein
MNGEHRTKRGKHLGTSVRYTHSDKTGGAL